MDTSVTIIGLIITLIIGIPLFFMFRSNSVNKKKINEIIINYSQNNKYNFKERKIQNKKVFAIDEIKKAFLLIDLNKVTDKIWFINLKEIKFCKLVSTTENRTNTILKIEFLFQHKDNNLEDILMPVYDIEDDQIGQVRLHEDHNLAKEWTKIIQDCIVRQNM